MKKILVFVLVLAIIVSTCGCFAIPTPKPQILPANWALDFILDDFGDKTDACMQSTSIGSFSNADTTDADLATVIFFVPAASNDDMVSYFVFRLYEENDHAPTYSLEDNLVIKIKVNDEIFEETLAPDESNGDLYLWYSAKEPSEVYKQIYNSMLIGNDVRCIIELGASKYNFTIESDGFVDSANAMMKTYGYDQFDASQFPVE